MSSDCSMDGGGSVSSAPARLLGADRESLQMGDAGSLLSARWPLRAHGENTQMCDARASLSPRRLHETHDDNLHTADGSAVFLRQSEEGMQIWPSGSAEGSFALEAARRQLESARQQLASASPASTARAPSSREESPATLQPQATGLSRFSATLALETEACVIRTQMQEERLAQAHREAFLPGDDLAQGAGENWQAPDLEMRAFEHGGFATDGSESSAPFGVIPRGHVAAVRSIFTSRQDGHPQTGQVAQCPAHSSIRSDKMSTANSAPASPSAECAQRPAADFSIQEEHLASSRRTSSFTDTSWQISSLTDSQYPTASQSQPPAAASWRPPADVRADRSKPAVAARSPGDESAVEIGSPVSSRDPTLDSIQLARASARLAESQAAAGHAWSPLKPAGLFDSRDQHLTYSPADCQPSAASQFHPPARAHPPPPASVQADRWKPAVAMQSADSHAGSASQVRAESSAEAQPFFASELRAQLSRGPVASCRVTSPHQSEQSSVAGSVPSTDHAQPLSVSRPISLPDFSDKAEEDGRLEAEFVVKFKAEDARLQAELEAKRKAREHTFRAALEEKRKSEEARLQAELESKRKADEDAIQADLEGKRKAEEARLQAELEAKRRADEDAFQADLEGKRKAEEDAIQSDLEEKWKAEEARLQAELEAKRRADEDAFQAGLEGKRKAEEDAIKADLEGKRKVEEARLQAELEAKRKADEDAFQADLEGKRKAEEVAFQADLEGKRKAEEVRLQAELEAKRKADEDAFQAELEGKRKAQENAIQADLEGKRKAEEARLQAELEAKRRADEDALQADLEGKRKAEEDAFHADLEGKRKAEEARLQAELEAKRKADEDAFQADLDHKRKAEEAWLQAELEAKRKAEEDRLHIDLNMKQKAREEEEAERLKRQAQAAREVDVSTSDKSEPLQPLVIQPSTPREHVEFVGAERSLSSPRWQADHVQTSGDNSESASAQIDPIPLAEAPALVEADWSPSSPRMQLDLLQTSDAGNSEPAPAQIDQMPLAEATPLERLVETELSLSSPLAQVDFLQILEAGNSESAPAQTDVMPLPEAGSQQPEETDRSLSSSRLQLNQSLPAPTPVDPMLRPAARVLEHRSADVEAVGSVFVPRLAGRPLPGACTSGQSLITVQRETSGVHGKSSIKEYECEDPSSQKQATQFLSSLSREHSQHLATQLCTPPEHRDSLHVSQSASSSSDRGHSQRLTMQSCMSPELTDFLHDTYLLPPPGIEYPRAQESVEVSFESCPTLEVGSPQDPERSESGEQSEESTPRLEDETLEAPQDLLREPLAVRSTASMATTAGRSRSPVLQGSTHREMVELVAEFEAEQSQLPATDQSSGRALVQQAEHPQLLRKTASDKHSKNLRTWPFLSTPTREVRHSKDPKSSDPVLSPIEMQLPRACLASSTEQTQAPATNSSIAAPEVLDWIPVAPSQPKTSVEHVWPQASTCLQPSVAGSSSASARVASVASKRLPPLVMVPSMLGDDAEPITLLQPMSFPQLEAGSSLPGTAGNSKSSCSHQKMPPKGLQASAFEMQPVLVEAGQSGSSPRLEIHSSQPLLEHGLENSSENLRSSREPRQQETATLSTCFARVTDHTQPLESFEVVGEVLQPATTSQSQRAAIDEPDLRSAEKGPVVAALELERLQPMVIQPSTPREHVELVPTLRSVSSFRLEENDLLRVPQSEPLQPLQGKACDMQSVLVAAVQSVSSPRLELESSKRYCPPSSPKGKTSSKTEFSRDCTQPEATMPSVGVSDHGQPSSAVDSENLQPMVIQPSTPREHVELVAAAKPMSCVRWEVDHLEPLAVHSSEQPLVVQLSTPRQHMELLAAEQPTSCVRWESEHLQPLTVNCSESSELSQGHGASAELATATRWPSSPKLEAGASQSPHESQTLPGFALAAAVRWESSPRLEDSASQSPHESETLPGLSDLAQPMGTATQKQPAALEITSIAAEHMQDDDHHQDQLHSIVPERAPSETDSSEPSLLLPTEAPEESASEEQPGAETVGLESAVRIEPGCLFTPRKNSSSSSLCDSFESEAASSASSIEHEQPLAAQERAEASGRFSHSAPASLTASSGLLQPDEVIDVQPAAVQTLFSMAETSEKLGSEAEVLSWTVPPESESPSKANSHQAVSAIRLEAEHQALVTCSHSTVDFLLSSMAHGTKSKSTSSSLSSDDDVQEPVTLSKYAANPSDQLQPFATAQLMTNSVVFQPPEVTQASDLFGSANVPQALKGQLPGMEPSVESPNISSPSAAANRKLFSTSQQYELQEYSERCTPQRESCWDVLERLHLLDEQGSPDLSQDSCLEESSSDAACLPARLQFSHEGVANTHVQHLGVHSDTMGAAVDKHHADGELASSSLVASVVSTTYPPRRLPAADTFVGHTKLREEQACTIPQDAASGTLRQQQQSQQQKQQEEQNRAWACNILSGSAVIDNDTKKKSPTKKHASAAEFGAGDVFATCSRVQKVAEHGLQQRLQPRMALDASRVDDVLDEPSPVSLCGPGVRADLMCERRFCMPEHHSIGTPNRLVEISISTPSPSDLSTPRALPQTFGGLENRRTNNADPTAARDHMELESHRVGSMETQTQTSRWQWPASWESLQSEPSTMWVDSACLGRENIGQMLQNDLPYPSRTATSISNHLGMDFAQVRAAVAEAMPSPTKLSPTKLQRSNSVPPTRLFEACGSQRRSWSMERMVRDGITPVVAPCWKVQVDRSDGSLLGINLNSTTLEVEEIRGGLIHSWNCHNPVEAVCVGDRVIEVNGQRDASSIIVECQKYQVLDLTIMHSANSQWHGTPDPCSAELGVRSSNSMLGHQTRLSLPSRGALHDLVSLPPRHLGSTSWSGRSLPVLGTGALLPLGGVATANSARETADQLIQQVVAQRELFDEIDRESRRLAQREVAELADDDLALAAQREAASLRSECDHLNWQLWCHCLLRKALAAWRSAAPGPRHSTQAAVQVGIVRPASTANLLQVPSGSIHHKRMAGTPASSEDEKPEQKTTVTHEGRGRAATLALESPRSRSASRCSSSGSWGGLPLPASPMPPRHGNASPPSFRLFHQHMLQRPGSKTPRSPCSSRRSSRQQPGQERKSNNSTPCSSRRSSKQSVQFVHQSPEQPTKQLAQQPVQEEPVDSSPLLRLRKKPSIVIQVPISPPIHSTGSDAQARRSKEAVGTQDNALFDSGMHKQVDMDQSRAGTLSAAEVLHDPNEALASVGKKPVEVRCNLAHVTQSAMQACDMAAKVRGLRMATRMAQRECREYTQDLKKWSEIHAEECQKSAGLQQQLHELQVHVEELKHCSSVGGSKELARTISNESLSELISLPSSAISSTEVFEKIMAEEPPLSELREMHVRAEAQQVFFQAVLAAIKNVAVQSEPGMDEQADDLPSTATGTEKADDPPSLSTSTENAQQLPANLTPQQHRKAQSLELPGVQPRREPGMSRGPSWASNLNLPELGTPKNPKQDTWGDEQKRRPRRYRSAQLLEPTPASPETGETSKEASREDGAAQESAKQGESNAVPPDLLRLRRFLEESLAQGQDVFAAAPLAPRPSATGSALTKVAEFVTGEVKPMRIPTGDSHQTSNSSCMPPQDRERGLSQALLAPELLDLIGAVLAWWPKLVATTAPEEVRRAVEVMKEGEQQWDAMSLEPHERARVLREGVACSAVDPELLAALLGRQEESELREAFCAQWVAGWLPPYLEEKRDKFGAAPQAETRSLLKFRTPVQQYGRQCGRVIVDGMRDLFGRAMRLHNVEQEALTRLLEEFAHALCLQTEIQERFRYVVLPDEERPKDVESLEHAVFLLTYHALLLNTCMNNTNARLSSSTKVPTRSEFSRTGSSIAGFREDFCKKMFDLIKQQPLGL